MFNLFIYHIYIYIYMSSIKLIKHKYEHYIDDKVVVCLDNYETQKYNIYIVYYINCLCNKNWFSWLFNQINLVTYMNATIYIISTVNQSEECEFRKKILEIFPNVNIECYYENEFEYRGIKKIRELGQIYNKRNDILLYFHSKGVTRYTSYELNKNLKYNIILKDIELIKEIFTIFPIIDKIGYSCGGIGWIWYNFWYVRGSYVNNLEEPVKTNRRHYYEDYIARKVNCESDKNCLTERPITYYENTLNSCYGIYTDKINIKNIGSYYNPNNKKYYNFDGVKMNNKNIRNKIIKTKIIKTNIRKKTIKII